ncbi:glycoside hydrolase family 127 protein [Kineosporia sp. J2-2]|uniref:Glycoside hydrolase family 127 protein n=1 Tax=Kineosporia corallincola TaxID=2835133 RepID=A0ABS5TSH4_9ACTN|nr:beta-L-arabinofuranosidase domain-containing protein [Kineosporia corallincola]MBT0773728.1 glycoside hydrolase family 127 protein [Kineosporia corallincola]
MTLETEFVSRGPAVPRRSAAFTPLPLRAAVPDRASVLGAWQERNGAATLQHCLDHLETSGVVRNFRRLAEAGDGPPAGAFAGMWFADSDLYKTLEAIGWEIGRTGTDRWNGRLDEFAALLEAVQADDGYLNTFVQGVDGEERFAQPERTHELYSAGHLIQAAVALHRGARDERFLRIARRVADLVVKLDDGQGNPILDGHPEVETALVELYRETGQEDYLSTARRHVDGRGHGALGPGHFGPVYYQDHLPVRETTEAIGHSVRHLYLAAGVTDVYLENGDQTLLSAVEQLWHSAFRTKMYITGGHGSRHRDESYGDPFELPPDRAYAETCASIAALQWCWRMLLATGEARYAEEMERALFNAIAASTSHTGTAFFYSNPLQLRTGHEGSHEDAPSERLSWYGCACCPPNIARLIASVQGYLATGAAGELQLHVLSAGTYAAEGFSVDVRTGYPYDGEVLVTAAGSGRLRVRIPAWAAGATAFLGDVAVEVVSGQYLSVQLVDGEQLRLSLPMLPVLVRADERVDAVRGCVAVTRGPLVFCVEQADLPDGVLVEQLRLDPAAPIDVERVSGQVAPVRLRLSGVVRPPEPELYPVYRGPDGGQAVRSGDEPGTGLTSSPRIQFTAIPYSAWANRGPGAMRVWLPVL